MLARMPDAPQPEVEVPCPPSQVAQEPQEITAGGGLTYEQRSAIQRARRPLHLTPDAIIPRNLARIVNPNSAKENLENTFELIGGVPAFALWADNNRSEFYRLYNKVLPLQLEGQDGRPLALALTSYLPPPLEKEVPNEAQLALDLG